MSRSRSVCECMCGCALTHRSYTRELICVALDQSNYGYGTGSTRVLTSLLSPWVEQKKTRVLIWLYEDTKLQIEGQIIGFDEYMNMTLEDAVEVVGDKRTEVGRILLKGDSITLLQEANVTKKEQL